MRLEGEGVGCLLDVFFQAFEHGCIVFELCGVVLDALLGELSDLETVILQNMRETRNLRAP